MNWFEITGTAAAVCMVFGYLPQAIATIRTRNTDGIALPTFLLMGLGSLLFVIQGFLSTPMNLPLMVCSATVFGIKMHNDHFHKR